MTGAGSPDPSLVAAVEAAGGKAAETGCGCGLGAGRGRPRGAV